MYLYTAHINKKSQGAESQQNKNVFRSCLNSLRHMSHCRSSTSRLFHSRGPATEKLLSPSRVNSQCVCVLKDNLFEWHFTIRGPADSEFDGGIYHGRIILPPEYPMKPPSIIILTVCEALQAHCQSCCINAFILHIHDVSKK